MSAETPKLSPLFAAACLAPWIFFLSTSIALLRANSEEFIVSLNLLGFHFAAFCFFAFLLFAIATQKHYTRIVLRASLAVVGVIILRQIPKSLGVPTILFGPILFAVIYWLSGKLNRKQLTTFMMLFFIVSVFIDLVLFVEVRRVPQEESKIEELTIKQLPNIYHFLFDAYQGDIFDLHREKDESDAFRGFIFFDDTRICRNL